MPVMPVMPVMPARLARSSIRIARASLSKSRFGMACLWWCVLLLCVGWGEAGDYPSIDKRLTADQWMEAFNGNFFVRVEFFKPVDQTLPGTVPLCHSVFDGGARDRSAQKLYVPIDTAGIWHEKTNFRKLKVDVVRYVESYNGAEQTKCFADQDTAAGPWSTNRWNLVKPNAFDIFDREKKHKVAVSCTLQKGYSTPPKLCDVLKDSRQRNSLFCQDYSYLFAQKCASENAQRTSKLDLGPVDTFWVAPAYFDTSYGRPSTGNPFYRNGVYDHFDDDGNIYPRRNRNPNTLPWPDYTLHRSLSFVEYWLRFGREGFWQNMPFTASGTTVRSVEDLFKTCDNTQTLVCKADKRVHLKMSVWVGQRTKGGDEDYDRKPAAVWPQSYYDAWLRQAWDWKSSTKAEDRQYDVFESCLHCPMGDQVCATAKCPSGTYASHYLDTDLQGNVVPGTPAVTCVPCAPGTWHTSAQAGVTYWDIPKDVEWLQGSYTSNYNVMNHLVDSSLFPIFSCFPCRYAPNLVHNGNSAQYVVYTDEFYCPGGSSGPVKCATGEVHNSNYTSCGCRDGYFKDPDKTLLDPSTNAMVAQCSPCPIGHRCDGRVKTLCGDDEYQDREGQSECKKCSEDGETALIDVCRDNTYMRKCIGASVGWHTLSPPVCVPCNACRRAGMNSAGLEECYLGGN